MDLKMKSYPKLGSSNPTIGQKNFKGSQLELTFSEPIKLKDAKEEILITPTPGKNTTYTVKKNKLIIEPENDWKENTTYNLNFREGVQDLTEGNPVENLRLAFSTGPEIDSLSIEGGISLTFSDKIPKRLRLHYTKAIRLTFLPRHQHTSRKRIKKENSLFKI